MPLSALPTHLQANRYAAGDGTDWDNPLQRHWDRAWFAFGPNATPEDWGRITLLPIPWTRYRIATPFRVPGKWRRFPFILFGYNITRWMAKGDRTVFYLPGLAKKFIVCGYVFDKGKGWRPLANPKRMMNAETRSEPTSSGYLPGDALLNFTGPSPIQQFTNTFSFQLCWPWFFAVQFGGTPKKDRAGSFDPKFFLRLFCRWVSNDDMYDVPSIFLGGTSN